MIAGVLLIFGLHYLFDQPTRPSFIQSLFDRVTPADAQSAPHGSATEGFSYRPDPSGVLDYQQLVADLSFERWEVHPEPIPQTWFSSVTIGPSPSSRSRRRR